VRVPSEKPLLRLDDILENIGRVERFTSGMDEQSFTVNEQALYACLHALLIISEAARKLDALLKNSEEARKLGDEADTLADKSPASKCTVLTGVRPDHNRQSKRLPYPTGPSLAKRPPCSPSNRALCAPSAT